MENRFISFEELNRVFEQNLLSEDILTKNVIGVSEVCDCSHLIEGKKIEGIHETVLQKKFLNLEAAIKNGHLWVIELDAFRMSNALLDDDFYNDFCNKKGNPYILSKRMTLYFDSNLSYWNENIYTEAFEDD